VLWRSLSSRERARLMKHKIFYDKWKILRSGDIYRAGSASPERSNHDRRFADQNTAHAPKSVCSSSVVFGKEKSRSQSMISR
jgi:hypothetical protein